MNPFFSIDVASVGRHVQVRGGWFRQNDIRAVAEKLLDGAMADAPGSTPGAYNDRPALHNTQILRRLEMRVSQGQARKQEGEVPKYQLVPGAALEILEVCVQHSSRTENFQEFLMLYYFLAANRELLMKILSGELHHSRRKAEVSQILNSRHLVQQRLLYLEQLEEHWKNKIDRSHGLIENEKRKKIWSPSIEWIQYQKKILSSNFTPDYAESR